MSFSVIPLAAAAIMAISAVPQARAGEQTCTKDVFGNEHCKPKVSTKVHAIIAGVLVGIMVLIGLIWFLVRRSRNKKAAAQAETVSYATQPSTYDPNPPYGQQPMSQAPVQYGQQPAYPFNGYENQAPPPTYGGYGSYPAPPGAPPHKETV
ncbi:hypothetical protein PLICRDRAFT_38951 [Plicaturopsis crispa FD-325 SS-3]|nr:hypothetical protein PLICRDRAFT_38951 [Plicaturopsis crispa FD-325 SS-3]